MNAFDLDTPAHYVDLDVMENNLRTMQARCDAMGKRAAPNSRREGNRSAGRRFIARRTAASKAAHTWGARLLGGTTATSRMA